MMEQTDDQTITQHLLGLLCMLSQTVLLTPELTIFTTRMQQVFSVADIFSR